MTVDRRRSEPIRVMVVDDHSFYRAAVREILTEAGLSVVAEAPSGERALEVLPHVAPDVVVIDLSMPGMGGIEAIRRITAAVPRARVLVLSGSDDEETVVEAILAGACGYLVKGAAPEEIPEGVRAAYGGAAVISPAIGETLLNRLRSRERAHVDAVQEAQLDERELEVLRLVAQGLSTSEIAEAIYASPSTVKNQVSNILAKLQLENRIQAAVYAAQRGLV